MSRVLRDNFYLIITKRIYYLWGISPHSIDSKLLNKRDMNKVEMNEKIAMLCKALETRNYDDFLAFFADNAVFEIPFTANGGTKIEGITKIKEHFVNIQANPISKLVQIEKVTSKNYFSNDEGICTVEYFTEGLAVKTQKKISIQSSVAIIKFENGNISHYKDFPNTLGLANAAGVLPQILEHLSKSS